jgi:hypothetical protein
VAALLTWIALGPPGMLATVACELFTDSHRLLVVFVFLSYGAFSLLACFMLRHSLSRRIYSF